MFSVKQRIFEADFTIPIYFLDDCREVWKRHNIAMFGKPSIEDFVDFCLSASETKEGP
jgi:hypothetical protein